MKEDLLRRFLQRLGIRVEGANAKRGKPGTIWLDFRCPAAPYSQKHGYKPDKSPSAGAVADITGHASRWSCHACKAHGTIHDLARYLQTAEGKEGIDYDRIAEEIIDAEFSGMSEIEWGQDMAGFNPAPEPLIEEAYEGLWPNAYEVEAGARYLASRRITKETAEKLGLLYDPNDTPPADWRGPWTPQPRIMFPVRGERGELYGWSGRAILAGTKPKVRDYEGLPKRWLILGQHDWRPGLPLVIVEGLFAYARLRQLGLEDRMNVGALLGSELTPEKRDVILTFGMPTYLLVDNDDAGDACLFGPIVKDSEPDEEGVYPREEEKSAIKLLQGQVPLFVPEFPEGKNDPDDLTVAEMLTILDETPPYGVVEVSWGGLR